MSLATNLMWSSDTGTLKSARVSLSLLTEISVAAYFALSFLYYLELMPGGHLINVSFLIVFAALIACRGNPIILPRRDIRFVGLLLAMAMVSCSAWIIRDDWDAGGLVRSMTWLTPVMLFLLLENSPPLHHRAMCYSIAIANLSANAMVTLLAARFNPELAKFEVDASWTWISSNELSFHLIAFVFLFFTLASKRRIGVLAAIVGLSSLLHLSKAHIVALVVAPAASFCGRKIWMVIAGVMASYAVLRWFALSDLAINLEFPDSIARVFNPIRDLLVIAGGINISDGLLNVAALSDSVGLFRFEVYEGAIDLLPNAWVGYSQTVIDTALHGLDPHSNMVYLVLREGWFPLALYLVATIWLIGRIPRAATSARVVIAVLLYVFIRTLFLTFDPVKLLCLGLYAGFVLRAKPAVR